MKMSLFTRFSCLLALCLLTGPLFAAPVSLTPADGLFAQGLFESARQTYANAVLTTPDDATPRIGLIRTLLRLDRWADALTEAQAAAKKFPANADAHGLLALALIRAGWQSPYAEEAKQSLTLDPNDYWGLVASGRGAEWEGHLDDARKMFRQASTLHPELPDAWLSLIQTLDEARDTKEILAVSGIYVKLHPQGHPHQEAVEDAQDFLDNAEANRNSFEHDSPFQHTPAGTTESSLDSVTFPIDFVGNYIVFPVTINGTRFRLLFDTGGGNDITLSRDAMRRLHLSALMHTFIRGVNGKEKSETYKADTMTVGGKTYHSIRIETAGFAPDSMDGIIGGDIFRDCLVSLDIKAGTATLTQNSSAQPPAPRPGNGSVTVPLRFYHDDLYVLVLLNNLPFWSLLDTGAEETTLSLRVAHEQLQEIPKEQIHSGSFSDRSGIGDTDRRVEYLASRDESTLAISQNPPVSIPMPTIGDSIMDREVSPSADFEIGMFLGMSSLSYAERLTFDYPRRLLTFEYYVPPPPPTLPDRKKPK